VRGIDALAMIAPVGAALASHGQTWSQPLGIGDRFRGPRRRGSRAIAGPDDRQRPRGRLPPPSLPPPVSSPSPPFGVAAVGPHGRARARGTLAGGTRPGRGALGSAHGLRRARGLRKARPARGGPCTGCQRRAGWASCLFGGPSTAPRRGPSVDEGIRQGHLREKPHLLVAGEKPERGPTRRTVAADLTPPVAFPHPINSVGSSPRVSVAAGPLQPISTPTI
jgi:hypothetical protein